MALNPTYIRFKVNSIFLESNRKERRQFENPNNGIQRYMCSIKINFDNVLFIIYIFRDCVLEANDISAGYRSERDINRLFDVLLLLVDTLFKKIK